MKNSALLNLWFTDVWNNHRLDTIDVLLHPDVRFEGTLDTVVSPGVDYKEVVTAIKSLLYNIDVKITHALDDGEYASVRVRVQGCDRTRSRSLDFTGQVIVRVQDARFVEFYTDFDYLGMFEQLGQFPEDTLPICLTGEKLVWTE